MVDDKERTPDMQLIMNTNHDKYGTLIKEYDREYIGRMNRYPKILQDTYSLRKGWNKHEKPGQTYPFKGGVSFNTMGEVNREVLVNHRAKHPPCSRCDRTSHKVNKCLIKKHNDGTMLHSVGEIEEADYEIDSEVSTEMTTNS